MSLKGRSAIIRLGLAVLLAGVVDLVEVRPPIRAVSFASCPNAVARLSTPRRAARRTAASATLTSAVAAPEPMSLLLLVIGGLVLARRR